MNKFEKFWGHLKTVNKHRFLVAKYCFKLGLYGQGLTHDLSKYSPIEFWSGVKYFQGNRSPIDAEKEDIGFSFAWQHHKGRNPHHWEYWVDNVGPREVEEEIEIKDDEGKIHKVKRKVRKSVPTVCEIPIKYVLEIICDWIAAGKVYDGEKWTYLSIVKYYEKCKSSRIFEKETERRIESILGSIKYDGIENTFYKINTDYGFYFEENCKEAWNKSWKYYAKHIQYKKKIKE